MMKVQIIFFILFIVVGFICILFGLYNIFYYRNLKKANGKIVKIVSKFSGSTLPKSVLYPVIEFIDFNKKKIRFTSKTGLPISNIFKIDYSKKIGEEIKILYKPEKPSEAVIEKDIIFLKLSPLIGGLLGLVLGIIGYLKFL